MWPTDYFGVAYDAAAYWGEGQTVSFPAPYYMAIVVQVSDDIFAAANAVEIPTEPSDVI